jgi:List-Bact-rpt repeat protein
MRSSSRFLGLVIAALLLVPTAQATAAEFPLVVQTEGSGSGTIECDEGSGPEPCDAEYPEGTELTLTADPDPGSEFYEWGGDCIGQPECEVTMDEAKLVSAVFELEEVGLEIFTAGTGTGEVECEVESGPVEECEAEYPFGTGVDLVAEPDFGSEFVEWEEDCTGSECELTLNEDKSVTAVFDLEPASEFALTVTLTGSGSGTVTSSPAGINCGIDCSEAYATGTEVTLTATPASGSTFAGWSGACTGTSCKVTMSQARSVTATFEKAPTPSPAPGTAVVARTAKVKGGKALLKLTCTGEGPCKGTLKLTAKIKVSGKIKNLTIGKGSFSLAAGAKKTLKVKLSGPAKKALAQGPLKAKVKGTGVRATTVKLKLAK